MLTWGSKIKNPLLHSRYRNINSFEEFLMVPFEHILLERYSFNITESYCGNMKYTLLKIYHFIEQY